MPDPTPPSDATTQRADAVLQALRAELRAAASDAPEPATPAGETPTPPAAVERLMDLVHDLQGRWQVQPAPVPGGRVSLIRAANRVLNRLHSYIGPWITHTYVRPVVQQQADFNGSVVRLSQQLYQMVRVLQDEARYLREETRGYDHHTVSTTRRLAQLELAVQRLAEEMAELRAAQQRVAGQPAAPPPQA